MDDRRVERDKPVSTIPPMQREGSVSCTALHSFRSQHSAGYSKPHYENVEGKQRAQADY